MDRFNFKKKFGQNFLRDTNIVKKIVKCADIKDNSLVIEVGPGKGILTKELSLNASIVLSYEIDVELKEYLENQFSNSNVEIIFDDFLNRNIYDDVKKYDYDNIYFISNVPYYITTPIIMHLIDSKIDFSKIVLMVQEEVGNRFSANPGTKLYSSITVFLNYFYKIKREFKVNRKEFVPIPNVDSVIVSFTKREEKLHVKDLDLFFKLVKDSFKYKRKTIKNNLSKYDLEIINNILEKNGFSLSTRAEQIPIDVFIEISNEL